MKKIIQQQYSRDYIVEFPSSWTEGQIESFILENDFADYTPRGSDGDLMDAIILENDDKDIDGNSDFLVSPDGAIIANTWDE
jgi:hypothetical protein